MFEKESDKLNPMLCAKRTLTLSLLSILVILLSSCGGVSFQKAKNLPSIGFQELESYYLENYPETAEEPIEPQDLAFYQDLRTIPLLADTQEIAASLSAIEQKLQDTANAASNNYQNVISIYMLLGQYHEALLSDNAKALSFYQKIWKEYQPTPFLHPYFDPKKKELTKNWYLLYSDAEALLKAGNVFQKMKNKQNALKCYERVFRYYSDQLTGPYDLDFPDRYGRVVVNKLIELNPLKTPVTEPVRSYSGDRRDEFNKLSAAFPLELANGNTKKWIGYISPGGVSIGYDRAERKMTAREAIVYQLQEKMGPQYEMLFGWVKSLNADPAEITVKVNFIGNQYEAVLAHPRVNTALHLNFMAIDAVWYLVGMYLY